MNLLNFVSYYLDEAICRMKFKEYCDKQDVLYPHCGGKEHYWEKDEENYECKQCGKRKNLCANTIMSGSRLPFLYWFIAIHLLTVTKFEHDPAGNLVFRRTENTEIAGRGDNEYQYHYNLLTNVNYPSHPENNVKYEYGLHNDHGHWLRNAIGRVVSAEDAAGFTAFSYGPLGEVTEEHRTFVLPGENGTFSFKTLFSHDTWNRMTEIVYPDNEKVAYRYDRGGQLREVKSDKNGSGMTYIQNISYNKFGQRDSIVYGNGTRNTYSYDLLRRLAGLRSLDGKSTDTYDYYKIRGDDNATALFEFVAAETNVEWSQAKLGQAGDKGLNYLTTSHGISEERGMGNLINGQLRFGYTAREFNHSHPRGTEYPSGSFTHPQNGKATGTWGDIGFARQATSIFGKSVNFHIYVSPNNKAGKGEQYIHFLPNSLRSNYGKMYHEDILGKFIDVFLTPGDISDFKPFKLREYKIADSVFYKKLHSILNFGECDIKNMNDKIFILNILDTLQDFDCFDDSLDIPRMKKSNCRVYSNPILDKSIKTSTGYFIMEDKEFIIHIDNKSILNRLFIPTKHYQTYYYEDPYFSSLGGYKAWHMILYKDNDLIFVGYELLE